MAHPIITTGVEDHAPKELGKEKSELFSEVGGKKEPVVDTPPVMQVVTVSEQQPSPVSNAPGSPIEKKIGAEADLQSERLQTERRMNALLCYIRARVGANEGEPTEMRPIDAQLAADLGVSRAWIYRKMDEVLKRGWQNATIEDFAVGKPDGGRGLQSERLQTERRMNALLCYIRARVGANEGEPTEMRPIDAQLAADLGVSRAWIYRKMDEVLKRGWQNATIEDFAVGKPDGGRGDSRLEKEVKAALDESIIHVCVKFGKKPGSRGAAKDIMTRMLTHHKIPEVKIPERPTISKWAKADHITAQRVGPYAENILNRPALLMDEPDALLSRVFLDWTLFTQDDRKMIVTTEDGRDIGPAHLVSAIDEATRLPWGWKWCLCTPNSFVIGQAIHHGTISKQPQLEKLGLRGLVLHGKPLLVRHDNGSDMIAEHTQTVIRGCGIPLDDMSPVTTPNYNAVQERWHGTAKGMFLDFLSDLADDKALCAQHQIRLDPKSGDIRIRWSRLEPLWVQWIVERYSKRPHKGLGGKTPLQRFESFVHGSDAHMSGIPPAVADTEEHRWRFLEADYRIVNQCGIQIGNRSYSHPDLRNLFTPGRRRSRTKVEIRHNRHSLRQVWAKDTKTGEIITVPIVSPRDFCDCTEAEWRLARKDLKRAGTEPQPQTVADLVDARRKQATTATLASNKTTRADRANHATHQADKAFFRPAVSAKAPAPLAPLPTNTEPLAPIILPSGNDAIGF